MEINKENMLFMCVETVIIVLCNSSDQPEAADRTYLRGARAQRCKHRHLTDLKQVCIDHCRAYVGELELVEPF